MTHGLDFDIAHALATSVLMMSFALIAQRRLTGLLRAFALQAVLVACAAGFQAHVQGEWQLYVTALLTLVVKALIVPIALGRIIRRLGIHREIEPALGIGAALLVGALLVALSIMLVLPITRDSGAITREHLALAMSIVLIGMLLMIARRNAVGQIIGFMSLENGLVLAAAGARFMPLAMEMSLAVSVLVVVLVFGMFIFRIRERFDSVDLQRVEEHRGDRPVAP